MSLNDGSRILPAHIEDTVQTISKPHARHCRQATPLQRTIEQMTARAARPKFVAIVTVLMLGWAALNEIMLLLASLHFNKPPFATLQWLIGVAALYMTMLILMTQRREDELTAHGEQLTLELAI